MKGELIRTKFEYCDQDSGTKRFAWRDATTWARLEFNNYLLVESRVSTASIREGVYEFIFNSVLKKCNKIGGESTSGTCDWLSIISSLGKNDIFSRTATNLGEIPIVGWKSLWTPAHLSCFMHKEMQQIRIEVEFKPFVWLISLWLPARCYTCCMRPCGVTEFNQWDTSDARFTSSNHYAGCTFS